MLSRVLFISPKAEDAACLVRMLGRISIRCDCASSLREARDRLHETRYGVLLTESALPDGAWSDVLELARESSPATDVVVTLPDVDERLWAEVLNCGCYDMLAQPFSEIEVQRVLSRVCERAA